MSILVILGAQGKESINEVMLNESEYVHQFVCLMVKKEKSIMAGKTTRHMHHFAKYKQSLKTPHCWKQPQLSKSHSSCSLVSSPNSRNYIYSWVCCLVFQQQSKPGKLDFNDLTACRIWHSKFHSDNGWELMYWFIFAFILRLSLWQLCF